MDISKNDKDEKNHLDIDNIVFTSGTTLTQVFESHCSDIFFIDSENGYESQLIHIKSVKSLIERMLSCDTLTNMDEELYLQLEHSNEELRDLTYTLELIINGNKKYMAMLIDTKKVLENLRNFDLKDKCISFYIKKIAQDFVNFNKIFASIIDFTDDVTEEPYNELFIKGCTVSRAFRSNRDKIFLYDTICEKQLSKIKSVHILIELLLNCRLSTELDVELHTQLWDTKEYLKDLSCSLDSVLKIQDKFDIKLLRLERFFRALEGLVLRGEKIDEKKLAEELSCNLTQDDMNSYLNSYLKSLGTDLDRSLSEMFVEKYVVDKTDWKSVLDQTYNEINKTYDNTLQKISYK